MTERKQDYYNGTGDVDLWLMKMKFYCSTKKFEGKQEAHAIASKLEGAAFLCIARLPDADQDDPTKVKAALRKEFDKEAIDHEKAVDELRGLKRKTGETPPQLAWRIEKLMRKAYPELCTSEDESAQKTHRQMLQDAFLGAIDDVMSQRLKSDTKHREFDLTKLAEELDRLELIYKSSSSQVNNVRRSDSQERRDKISFRKMIREEVAAALAKESDEIDADQADSDSSKRVSFVGKRKFPPRNPTRRERSAKGRGCFHCESSEHFKKDCPYKTLCQRCWQKGHTAPLCNAPCPRPSPSLNFKAAGIDKP